FKLVLLFFKSSLRSHFSQKRCKLVLFGYGVKKLTAQLPSWKKTDELYIFLLTWHSTWQSPCNCNLQPLPQLSSSHMPMVFLLITTFSFSSFSSSFFHPFNSTFLFFPISLCLLNSNPNLTSFEISKLQKPQNIV
ncbi:hypothetical protein VIGAN_10126100, partial [Vigna angularis var. angularis]